MLGSCSQWKRAETTASPRTSWCDCCVYMLVWDAHSRNNCVQSFTCEWSPRNRPADNKSLKLLHKTQNPLITCTIHSDRPALQRQVSKKKEKRQPPRPSLFNSCITLSLHFVCELNASWKRQSTNVCSFEICTALCQQRRRRRAVSKGAEGKLDAVLFGAAFQCRHSEQVLTHFPSDVVVCLENTEPSQCIIYKTTY